jgi:TatD family hydrolase
MDLFDAHCHMQDERLLPDLVAVMERTRSAGIRHLWNCGSCEEDWPALRKLAAEYEEILPSYGLHPWYVGERTDRWLNALEEFLRSAPAAGVGEIGLDYHYNHAPPAEQRRVFARQIRLARDARMPIVIHTREADEDTLAILDQGSGAGQIGVAGSVISYAGVAIGSVSGGTAGADLVVAFNASATSAAALTSSAGPRSGSPWIACANASPKPVEPL